MPLVHIAGPARNAIAFQTGVVAEAELEVIAQVLRVGNGNHHLLEKETCGLVHRIQHKTWRAPHMIPHHFGPHNRVGGHHDGIAFGMVFRKDDIIAVNKGVPQGVARNIVA